MFFFSLSPHSKVESIHSISPHFQQCLQAPQGHVQRNIVRMLNDTGARWGNDVIVLLAYLLRVITNLVDCKMVLFIMSHLLGMYCTKMYKEITKTYLYNCTVFSSLNNKRSAPFLAHAQLFLLCVYDHSMACKFENFAAESHIWHRCQINAMNVSPIFPY